MMPTAEAVEEIQSFLYGEAQLDGSRLLSLARAYAEACTRVNKKALQCRDLLHKGLRNEAICVAKEEYDLKEEFQLVSFDENDAWFSVCEKEGLPIPDLIDSDLVTTVVEEIYTGQGNIDRLLRVYRLMSLARAPVVDLIRVLRLIAKEDPRQRFWRQDVRTFEKARLDELHGLADEAAEKGDRSALEDIVAELTGKEWLERPPERLIRSAQKSLLPHRREAAQARFGQLLEEIRQAHSALDEPACREAVATWHATIDQTRIQPDAADADQVAQVEEWLRSLEAARQAEAEFQQACDTLDAALNDRKDRAVVEKELAQVRRFGQGMPSWLKDRAEGYLAELRRRARVKGTFILVGTVAGVLLAGGAVWLAVLRHRAGEEQRSWVNQITACLNKKDLAGAEKLLKDLERKDPGFHGSAEIGALRVRLAGEVEQVELAAKRERERKEHFAKAMALARSAGVTHPDRQALATAKGLARTPEEKGQVTDLEQRIAEARRVSTEERKAQIAATVAKAQVGIGALTSALDPVREPDLESVEKLAKRCTSFLDLLDGLPKKNPLSGSISRQRVAKAQEVIDEAVKKAKAPNPARFENLEAPAGACAELCRLLAASKELSKEQQALLAGAADAADKALKAAKARFETDRKMAADWKGISRLYARPEELGTALVAFASTYPNHAFAKDLAAAATMTTQCRSMGVWEGLVKPWRAAPPVSDAQEAERRHTALDQFRKDHGSGPWEDAAKRYAEYLRAAVDTLPKDRLPAQLADIQQFLNDDLIAASSMFVTRTGSRYYLLKNAAKEIKLNARVVGWRIDYVVDSRLTTKPESLRMDALALICAQGPIPAPQNALSKSIRQEIGRFDGPGWETLCLRLADLALQDTTVDPILRAGILKSLLESAAQFTPHQAEPIKKTADRFENLPLEVYWMDPKDEDANKARGQVARSLEEIDRKTLTRMIQDVHGGLDGLFPAPSRCAGIIFPRRGEVVLHKDLRDADLYVISGESGKTPAMVKVGFVAGGKFASAGPAGGYPVGSCLFARARHPAGSRKSP